MNKNIREESNDRVNQDLLEVVIRYTIRYNYTCAQKQTSSQLSNEVVDVALTTNCQPIWPGKGCWLSWTSG